MDPENRRSARKWWLLIGGAVVLLSGLSLLEDLVREEPQPSASAEDTRGLFSSATPQLRRLDDGAIEIRHDFFRRTTIRLGDEDAERALFDCLVQGIKQTFGGGVEDWDRESIRSETLRIQGECLSSLDVAVPAPPSPTGAGRHR